MRGARREGKGGRCRVHYKLTVSENHEFRRLTEKCNLTVGMSLWSAPPCHKSNLTEHRERNTKLMSPKLYSKRLHNLIRFICTQAVKIKTTYLIIHLNTFYILITQFATRAHPYTAHAHTSPTVPIHSPSKTIHGLIRVKQMHTQKDTYCPMDPTRLSFMGLGIGGAELSHRAGEGEGR